MTTATKKKYRHLAERFDDPRPHYKAIPRDTLASLKRYTCERIPTGGALRAVLSNDLFVATRRLDEENMAALKPICQFVWNELPSEVWGSPEKVDAWLRRTE